MAGRKGRRSWGWLRQTSAGRWHASYIGPDMVRHNAPSTFDSRKYSAHEYRTKMEHSPTT